MLVLLGLEQAVELSVAGRIGCYVVVWLRWLVHNVRVHIELRLLVIIAILIEYKRVKRIVIDFH